MLVDREFLAGCYLFTVVQLCRLFSYGSPVP